MIRNTLIALSIVLPSAVLADEFTDVVREALTAYEEGDVAGAREELDYAMKLLSAMKADVLAAFLPAAPAGWTRSEAEASGAGAAMAMFGGGTSAAATYIGTGSEMTLSLLANSPMISGIAAMVSGLGGVTGEMRRIQRTQFVVNDGEMQGVVGDRVLVSVSGTATPDEMAALVEMMDLGALGDF